MKLDVFGRWIELVSVGGEWVIYDLGEGKKRLARDVVIPGEMSLPEAVRFLEDMFHEQATPERSRITEL